MNYIKSLFVAAIMLVSMTVTVNAQTDEGKTLSYPQIFLGLQGGGQTTFTAYNNWKLITPTASFSVGSFFTPVIGARLHFNGFWNKGGYRDDTEDFMYSYKYLTSELDLMVNLVTLIGKKSYYPLNVYLIGGLGMNYAWDNSPAFARQDIMPMAYEYDRFSHNARIGVQLDCNLSKHVSVNLEVAGNTLNDRYNSQMKNTGDWQLTVQLGVAYKFAARNGKKETKLMDESPL